MDDSLRDNININELLDIHWPNRTIAEDRSVEEQEILQSWVDSYIEDWDQYEIDENQSIFSSMMVNTVPCGSSPCGCVPLSCDGTGTEIGEHYFDTAIDNRSGSLYKYMGIIGKAQGFHIGNLHGETVWGEFYSQNLTNYLHFKDINVPPSSVIDKAYIEFRRNYDTYDQNSNIEVVIAGYCNQAGTNFNPSTHEGYYQQPMTATMVEWTVEASIGPSGIYRTPNIACIVQEMLNRQHSHLPLTELVFFINPKWGGGQHYISFNNGESSLPENRSYPPQLHLWAALKYGVVCNGSANNFMTRVEDDDNGVIIYGRGGAKLSGSANVFILKYNDEYDGETQISIPIGDLETEDQCWTESPLYQKIDEIEPDDEDFIRSAENPDECICTMNLSPLDVPITKTGHKVKYRLKQSNTYGEVSVLVQLMQEDNVIAGWLEEDLSKTEWIEYERTLTQNQTILITDYSKLRVRFVANTI